MHTRTVESKSLKESKSQKFKSQKNYFINGDVMNPESEGSAQNHNNSFQINYNLKMLITLERKVFYI